MAISYTLGSNPFWYMADAYGKPLGGGGMYVASSLNPTIPEIVYQDAGGTLAWPTSTLGDQNDVILFDENGVQGPFYFSLDSADPRNLYYIKFFDSNGNPLEIINDYFPAGGGGGGGTITTNYFIKNYVVNNAFINNNADPTTGVVPSTTGTVVAPSNHAGYRFPDIEFIKNNTSSTDVMTIVNPLTAGSDFAYGQDPLTNDVTPEFYINFQTTMAGSAETQKIFQWPLDLHVKNMEQQEITVIVWANGVSGVQTISPFIWQDTGTGGAPTVIAPVNINTIPQVITTGTWMPYTFTYTIPSLAGINVGTCGNDATYLQIGMPLNNACNISFTKPKVYLGQQAMQVFPELQTYDDVNAICMSPRTGDVRVSLNSFSPYGWVPCNDGTIGDGSSGANSRANIDTFSLFNLIWTQFSANQTLAPMFDDLGNPVSYGATSIDDFTAHNRLSLTKTLGRVLANVGTPSSGTNTGINWAIGQTTGNEEHSLTLGEIPSHVHSVGAGSQFVETGGANNTYNNTGANAGTFSADTGAPAGYPGQTALVMQPPTAYFNVFLKL